MASNSIKARGQVTLTKLYDGTNGTDGKNGSDGAIGAPGEDGKTTYVHIAYANSADGKTDFSVTDTSGRTYIGVLTDFVEKDSTNPSDYTWSLIKGAPGADGQNGEDGAPGAPGEDGKTTYVHIAYANSIDGSTDFSTTDNVGKLYIGVLTDEIQQDSTDYTKYTWSLFKGKDGEDGADGTPGKPGADGKTPYVHFAYANSSDGKTDFSTTVYTNKQYIGTLTDYTVADSTDYTKYTWSLIKGADGADGIPGKPGADGKTPYVHFAYANSADGKTDFSTTVYSGKTYLGTLTDYTVADSTDYTMYTWSRLKGDTGVGIANTVIEYQLTDTQDQPSDDSGWTTTIPNLGAGTYLWTRTTLMYTDGTSSKSYTISKQSDNTYTAVLTNDSITLPADSTGKVTDFSNSTGNFLVYDGTYQVDPTTVKIQLVQAVNVTVTIGGNSYTITAMDSSKDTGYFDLTYTYKGVALNKRVTVSKSKSGANGSTPVIVNLSANAQVFTFDSNNNANPTAQNILFKTTVSGTTSTPVYKAIPYDDSGNAGAEIVLSNSGTNGKLLQVSQIGTYASIVVTATIGSVSDSTTIVRVKDGSSISPIPDPSNTVSSNTAPTSPKDGDWWNDTSQTPNVLKYSYQGKWIQYELDGYYVKANSISGEAIIANTLEAQKVKYTNSNGTTTNLQTFDFNGMKTVLSDNKGNTYSSMDDAVSSTQSWTSLSNQVNSLGQINQLFNTEWSPDFAGWNIGTPNTSGKFTTTTPLSSDTSWSLSSEKFNGSNVLLNTYGSGASSINSGLIPIGGNVLSIVALQAYSSSNYNGTVTASLRFYYYDSNQNYISSALKDSSKISSWTRLTASSTSPSNAAYVVVAFVTNGSVGTSSYSQPIMVFSGSIGDYVQGNYNNNARVLAIETSASQFQVKIGNDVSKAQTSADTANTSINNLSIGGRNLLLNSKVLSWGVGTNTATTSTKVSYDSATNMWHITSPKGGSGNAGIYFSQTNNVSNMIAKGQQWAFSFDIKGTGVYSQFGIEGSSPFNKLSGNVPTDWTRVSSTGTAIGTNAVIIYFNSIDVALDVYIKLPKLETGNKATDWTPAPEDIQAGITSAQSSADTANNTINNLSVGGRNLLLGTANGVTGVGTNSTNGNFNAQGGIWYLAGGKKVSDLYNQYGSSGYLTISFDWVASGSTISGTFIPQWNNTPWGGDLPKSAISPSSSNLSGHYENSVALSTNGYSTGPATGVMFRQDNLQGNITISNLKLESGNKATDWTPAPEDVYSQVLSTNLIVNSEFDNSTGSYTGWHLDNPWGTTVTTQISKNGNKSTADSGAFLYPNPSQMMVHDYSSSATWIYSDPIPVGANQPLSGSITNANPSGSTTNVGLALYVYAYDSNHNRISTVYASNLTQVHGQWIVNSFSNYSTPANTAYVSLGLGWNNGKGYFGQPMLQANTSYTGYVPGTPNSNMAIANAQTSADTANTNLANASQSGIRYLRFRGEGNTDNQASHFGNISVFNTVGTDILSGKTATTVGNPTISGNGLGAATDGKYNTTYTGIEYNATNHEQYIMFDLGSLRYDVNKIEIGMWTTTRTYYGVKAQSSTDGNTWQTIYVGNITPSQLVGNSTTGQVVGTTVSFGMDTSTVLKLAADNYTLGIDANGNLISGITGNTQSVTIKGAMIHLDGNTVVDQGFFSLWNGQYGSTTIDSTGMEVVTGKAKTKFGDGAMSLISAAGENIGWIGRQVDSVYSNLDFLTIGLNGWQTTAPGDEHYDKDPNNPDAFYGGDGIIFGISTVGGGYLPLLMYNTPLAASYRSGIAGWMFTQPIVGGIDIYGDNMKADNTVSWRFKNLNTRGFTYPFLTSQQADNANANTGIILGSGTMYFYGGNNAVMSIRQNGYGYYDAQKFGSGGSALYMAGDGALIAHSSATKYKTNIVRSSTTELGDKLLTLDLASWNDKDEDRQLKEYNETGKRTDYAIDMDGARYYGLIAEDLVKADLEEFVVRNPITSSVETIQYDKIGVAWIPLVRQQRDMINQLKFEIEKIKEKINE